MLFSSQLIPRPGELGHPSPKFLLDSRLSRGSGEGTSGVTDVHTFNVVPPSVYAAPRSCRKNRATNAEVMENSIWFDTNHSEVGANAHYK